MLKRVLFVLVLVAGLTLFIRQESQANPDPIVSQRPAYVAGEVLLKFNEGVTATAIGSFHQTYQTQVLHRFQFTDVYHLQLPASMTVPQALSTLGRDARVQYVEPNRYNYLDATTVIPNDALFTDLWAMNNTGQTGGTPDADIDAVEAWDINTGSSDVVIAVIDSGLDMGHEDIAANVWTNPGEIPGNGIDDDNNGYIDDVHGWDFSDDDNDPAPAGGGCLGHGTHTAGTVGAVGNNGVGVTGVNWNVKLMPIKAFEPILIILCAASDADLMESIEYQTVMGVRISNNSWGGSTPSQAMQDAILATRSVFVVAAGNSGNDQEVTPSYPSAYPLANIISVAATTDTDALAGFSDYGIVSVDLGAPGVGIRSTLPNGNYGNLFGTSMAAPHVAGAAGLLLSQYPDLTNNEVKWCLMAGTDATGLPVVTGGRLNVYKSLQRCGMPMAMSMELTPVSPTELAPGDTLSFDLTVSNTTASSVSGNVRLYFEFAQGQIVTFVNANITLNAGQSFMRNIAFQLPLTVQPGTIFSIFGAASTPASFDEARIDYTIVP